MTRLRVDHVSIAVHSIDRALEFFVEHFPARTNEPKQDGYDAFRWADFQIGSFKIELIESAGRMSFVERFLARHGEGFHHLSCEVDELDPLAERIERDGHRIVDRFDAGDGRKTAFVHPRSAFGTLIQFWQTPEMAHDSIAPSWGGVVEKNGTPWLVDHLSLALRSVAPATRFFERHFDGRIEEPIHTGYDGSFRLLQMRLGDYRLELMENASEGGFLGRFLAKHSEGMHHLSIDVLDLDAAIAPLERAGARIVDRFDFAPGWRTAFIHPKSCFGVLVQFWQVPRSEFPS
jgi:methylmalonyl-CoA/ethylmalonyl-CoA epimerase